MKAVGYVIFGLAFLIFMALFGCAAPRYEDGTRSGITSIPCDKDNCGKLP